MMSDSELEAQVNQLLELRIRQLRQLSFTDVEAMPETSGEEMLVADRKCALTVYVQKLTTDQLLLTVQIARSTSLRLGSLHQERGLVFAKSGAIREATASELMDSGG